MRDQGEIDHNAKLLAREMNDMAGWLVKNACELQDVLGDGF